MHQLLKKVEKSSSVNYQTRWSIFHLHVLTHASMHSTEKQSIIFYNIYLNLTRRFSGRFIEAKCEVVFPGQVVIHTYIRAINKLHRKYPKRFATKQDEELIYNEIEKTIPPKYHNSSIIREMRRNGRDHAYLSPTFCLPPPQPKEIIQPFNAME